MTGRDTKKKQKKNKTKIATKEISSAMLCYRPFLFFFLLYLLRQLGVLGAACFLKLRQIAGPDAIQAYCVLLVARRILLTPDAD